MFAVPDVETFISQNRVDQRAGDELRNSDLHTQAKVLERGDLSEARNPSALLLARIREAAAGTASDPDVLKFIMTHGIDDQAAQVLLSCPVHVKHYVLKQGGFGDARSPSAIVLARIRDGRKKLGLNMDVAGSGGGASANVSEEDIEAFINESNLDERAVSEFRKCPPEIQAQCVSRGELKSARNPSATLLSRMSQLRHMQLNYGVGGDKPGLEDWQIEAWLAEAGVDERAEGEFKGLPPPIQSLVMQKGNLKAATNPSAVLLTRIKHARMEIQQYPPGSQKSRRSQKGYWNNQGHQQVGSLEKLLLVEMFINQSGVDESAAAALRTCSSDVQEAIINRGELSTARNPSAVLLKRVRECNDDAMKGKGASSSGAKGWGTMQSKAASYKQSKLEEENQRLREEISQMKAQVNHINILEAITQLTQAKKARHW